MNFSKIVLKNWGRVKREYLWIHFDEQWFWRVILCKTANKSDGIKTEAVRAYHRYHISKIMGISVVGMDFDYSLENGGRAIKLFFQRFQSAKS